MIIIIGILGSLGFTQYTKVLEKARSAEAKKVLSEIRTAQGSYKLQHGDYADSSNDLSINAPSTCTSTHYFSYSANSSKTTAYRCTTGGKFPDAVTSYEINLEYDSALWGGNAGYY